MPNIRLVCLISIGLIILALVPSWFIGYADVPYAMHTPLFLVTWSFGSLGIARAASIIFDARQYHYKGNETFSGYLQAHVRNSAWRGGLLMLFIVYLATGDYGKGADAFYSAAPLAYSGCLILTTFIIGALIGQDSWEQPLAHDSRVGLQEAGS